MGSIIGSRRGQPKVNLGIRLDEAVYHRLIEVATAKGISLTGYIVAATITMLEMDSEGKKDE